MTDSLLDQINEFKMSRIEHFMEEIKQDTESIQNLTAEIAPDRKSNESNLRLINMLIHDVKLKIKKLNCAISDFNGQKVIW